MGENICKLRGQQEINLQDIQKAYVAQYKKKKHKHSNQKMGRISKQTFLQRRQTDGPKASEAYEFLHISWMF